MESVFICIGLKFSFKRKKTSCNSIKKEKLEDVLQNPQNFEKIISNLEEIKALKDSLNESEKICFSLDKDFNIVCFGSYKEELSSINTVTGGVVNFWKSNVLVYSRRCSFN